MEKIIKIGKENINGELVPAPFDNKNLLQDSLEELFFDGRCTHANSDSRICGFVCLDESPDMEMLCDLYYEGNTATYTFPCTEGISKDEFDYFCKYLEDMLSQDDNANYDVRVYCADQADGGLDNEIVTTWYFRSEEDEDDKTESYRVDLVHYDINDNKVYGDMGYSFNDFEERFPCSNYESDEEFKAIVLDGAKNCEEEQNDSEEIAIYKAYKEHGYHGELELIYTVACCSKEDAEKYGIKADAFTK